MSKTQTAILDFAHSLFLKTDLFPRRDSFLRPDLATLRMTPVGSWGASYGSALTARRRRSARLYVRMVPPNPTTQPRLRVAKNIFSKGCWVPLGSIVQCNPPSTVWTMVPLAPTAQPSNRSRNLTSNRSAAVPELCDCQVLPPSMVR